MFYEMRPLVQITHKLERGKMNAYMLCVSSLIIEVFDCLSTVVLSLIRFSSHQLLSTTVSTLLRICDIGRIKVSTPGDDKVLSLAEVKAWGHFPKPSGKRSFGLEV